MQPYRVAAVQFSKIMGKGNAVFNVRRQEVGKKNIERTYPRNDYAYDRLRGD
jgi:hypothetical protein